MSTKSICRSCEMLVGTDEYHPHAACLMYRTCGDETAVRLNLAEVMAHGAQEVAPDLLEALEYCVRQIPSFGTVPGIAEALAKAKETA